jgi:uncharacterized beta-barrel protein YwiB (DUF1934 family)
MTEEVLVSIKGLQMIEENNEAPVEVITRGTYFEKNGLHYIKYDEVYEDIEGTTRNLVKVHDGVIEVIKRGLTNVHMVFEINKKNMTRYQTPFGELVMGITTKEIRVQKVEKGMDIKVSYDLYVNYEYLAACVIDISVRSKEVKRFS